MLAVAVVSSVYSVLETAVQKGLVIGFNPTNTTH